MNALAKNPIVGVGVVALGAWLIFGRSLRAAAARLNPTDERNLAYSGVNAVGRDVSGDENWSLGVWLYELTHEQPQLTYQGPTATAAADSEPVLRQLPEFEGETASSDDVTDTRLWDELMTPR